ncbi:MAG: glycosyltransferase family 4 protein [Planctomycetota bacterium]
MKVLQCHNLYRQPGGEDRVVEDEKRLLEEHGHEVVSFTLHNDQVADLSKPRLAAGTVWSRRSARALRELVRRERPDIAHFHNTLPLMSPSSYYAVRGEGVPVVQTLHNYRLLCPKATFFRDNRVCEDCLTKKIKWPAVVHGCYRDSRSASAAVAAMLTVHGVAGTYRRAIDAYIVCSEFTQQKLIQGGYPADRLHYKPNFVTDDPGVGSGGGGYPLYVGRLSSEKGIEVLARAWELLPDTPLHLVGQGPMSPMVEDLKARRPRIVHHAYVEFAELQKIMADAAFIVLPSMTYEGFPKVIAEAYSHGVPVVATDTGAMTHIVVEGVTGRRFGYGDAEGLATIVRELMGDPDQVLRLRRGARTAYETAYTADANYRRLLEIYRHAQQRFQRSAAASPSTPPARPRSAAG